jgi:mevalonate kinase
LTIHIDSEIPIASGLGSGAAVTAALARGLAEAVGQALDNKTLNRIVYEVEKIHHGTPSGIDNTVVVYEQPVYFVRGEPVAVMTIGRPFDLLVVDSGKRALTRDAVGDVRTLYEADPDRIRPLLARIGEIAVKAHQKITSGAVDALGPLMCENHTLLQRLTVSSPELDRLVDVAMESGALGAKLSGGGRGGNMIVLVTESSRAGVEKALLHAGATRVLLTTVG